jgi:hypothetical protein
MKIIFGHYSAVVLKSEKHYISDTYSEGGGGWIGKEGGYISPPTIRTRTNLVQDVYLKLRSGKQKHLQLKQEVPLMNNNKVKVIFTPLNGQEYKLALIHYDSRQYYYLHDTKFFQNFFSYTPYSIGRTILAAFAGAIIAAMILAVIVSNDVKLSVSENSVFWSVTIVVTVSDIIKSAVIDASKFAKRKKSFKMMLDNFIIKQF